MSETLHPPFDAAWIVVTMSRSICFVCGSSGGENILHIKPREKGSYFPFLEHHDPPKGAKLPVSDGTVLACRVCHAMLNGQWDSYDRSKTPAIKRLYWLKRCDNGQFTGAEMKLQGEYAAQVMGLQYTPGSLGGASGSFSDYTTSPPSVPPYTATPRQPSPKKPKFDPPPVPDVLDLSVSSNTTPPKARPTASGSSKRNRKPDISKENFDALGNKETGAITCYLCGTEHPASLGRYIFSKKSVEGEPYFPFLEHIRPPKGAMLLTPQGLTRVCSNCRTTLSRQWKAYDSSSTPEHSRIYRINNELVGGSSARSHSEDLSNAQMNTSEEVMEFQEVCYLCGQVYHRDSMKLLYTRPPKENSKHSMYFPFVTKLQRHNKAKAVDAEGRVASCRACYSYLQRQWQSYQAEGIPAKDREFVLRPLTGKEDPSPKTTPKKTASEENGEVNQPLNIQISSAGSLFSVPAPGLLAIASGLTPQVMMGMLPIHSAMYQQYQQQLVAAVAQSSVADSTGTREQPQTGEVRESRKENRTAAQPNPPVTSKGSWCYICGFKCTGDKVYQLNSIKSKGTGGTTAPFFPFMRTREPALRAEKMCPGGTVKACRYCYHTLTYQWDIYERSQLRHDRDVRQYNVDTFVCFVCAKHDSRKNTRTVDLRYFPELVERKRPYGSLVMEAEYSVAVCVKCEHQLAVEYSEFEKKKIVVGQRPYFMPEAANDAERAQTSGPPDTSTSARHSSQVCKADPEPVKPDSCLLNRIDPPPASVQPAVIAWSLTFNFPFTWSQVPDCCSHVENVVSVNCIKVEKVRQNQYGERSASGS